MLLVKFFSRFPFWFIYALAEVIGFLLYHVIRYRRQVVRENLNKSFPEKGLVQIKEIERAFYRNFPLVFLEIIRSYRFDKDDWAKHVQFENPELAKALLDDGTPVIMMGGHVANYEWPAFAVGSLMGYPLEFIYKSIDNNYFNQLMLDLRKVHGGLPILKKQSLRQIVKRKEVPRVIGIIGDQLPTVGKEKHWATFLNQETAFYMGAEKIAALVDYAVFYIECRRIGRGRYSLHFHEIARPPYGLGATGITEAYARKLETTIQNQPADYLWSHKRWKYTREEDEAHMASSK